MWQIEKIKQLLGGGFEQSAGKTVARNDQKPSVLAGLCHLVGDGRLRLWIAV
jgi:hypothetical protein